MNANISQQKGWIKYLILLKTFISNAEDEVQEISQGMQQEDKMMETVRARILGIAF